MELCGEQSQPVFYGAFGEKEINGYLRGTRCLYQVSSFFLENSLQMDDTLSYYLNTFSDGVYRIFALILQIF